MKTLFIVLSLIPTLALAETSSVLGRAPNGTLTLSTGCNEIEEDLAAIMQWTQRLENRGCDTPAIRQEGEGMCSANVTSCVPQQVRTYQGLTGTQNGPNCWNLALVMAGLVPVLRQSSDTEWEYLINSPLCRELRDGESPQSGDLGSIEMRAPDNNVQIHGFMYVSDRMVFSKNGTLLNAPYALQTREDMESTYRVGQTPGGECESDCGPQSLANFMTDAQAAEFSGRIPSADVCEYGNLSSRPTLAQACSALREHVTKNAESCAKYCAPGQIKYFRCQTMQEFTRANGVLRPDFQNIEQIIGRMESCMERAIFDGSEMSSLNSFMSNNMSVLAAYLSNNTPRAQGEAEQLVLNSLALRLNAIGDTINPGNRVRSDFSRAFYQAMDQLPRTGKRELMGERQ